MTSLWRYCRDQYDRVIRIAGTVETVRLAAAFAFCVDVAAALRGDASAAPSASSSGESM